MAAVTVNSLPYTPKYNVKGSKREQLYNVSGNPGDTLTVGLLTVLNVMGDQPALVTKIVATPLANNQSLLTFTATGAFAGLNIAVTGN